MRILITGGTGLVGKALGIELVRRGHKLTLVSRNKHEARQNCPFPCDIIEADLTKGPFLAPSSDSVPAPKFEAVINLMGESIATGRWNESKKKRLIESRINATRNLRESVKAVCPDVFISASAIGIYGDRKNEILDEASPLGDDFLAELCKGWELEALALEAQGTRVVIPRIGVVLSEQGGFLNELTPLFKTGFAGPLAGGHAWLSWIHLEDLVNSIILALENSAIKGIYNAVAPQPVTNAEFTHTMGQLLKRPSVLPAPRWALQMLLQEKATIVLGSQRVVPTQLQSHGFIFKHTTLESALNQELRSEKEDCDHFIAQQFIAKTPEEIFPFFSEAKNLGAITPDSLGFKILSVSTPALQTGTLIDYSIKIHGVPVRWKTEILDWNPPHQFIDNQLKGPYSTWHHTHSFEKLGAGTLMTDRVQYKTPVGYLGWLTSHSFVRKEVEMIFSYRRRKIDELFNLAH